MLSFKWLRIARGVAPGNSSGHFLAAVDALAAAGIVDAPTERDRRKLYHPFKAVKPRRCRARKGFMQCRHGNGVMIDVFAPDAVWTPLTGLSAQDFLPPRPCRCFNATFPCPGTPVKALKQWTLDFGDNPTAAASDGGTTKAARRTWFEFGGCALLPRRVDERTPAHVRSVLATAKALERCRFPNLLSDVEDAACKPFL